MGVAPYWVLSVNWISGRIDKERHDKSEQPTAQLVGTSWDQLGMIWDQLLSSWAWCLTDGTQNHTKPDEFAYYGGPYPIILSKNDELSGWLPVLGDTMIAVNLIWGLTGQSIP